MNKQKILTIFDISKVLLLAERLGKQQYFDARMELESLKPNDKYEQYSIFWRDGRENILDFFMNQKRDYFDVGVWSSNDRDKTAAFAKSFFGKHYRNLLFVSATSRELLEGPVKEFSPEPIPVNRDLGQINLKFNQYDLHNIIMVSCFPNLSQLHQYNDLLIPKYAPRGSEVDQTLQSLIKYINGISLLLQKGKIQDVRTALRAKNFKNLDDRIFNVSQQYKEYL